MRSRMIFWLSLAVVLLGLPWSAHAHSHHPHGGPEPEFVSTAELPREAQDTLRLIDRRGPFPYPRDGIVFSNFERRLPPQPRGYYHEYTVRTPGVHNRGARRIVCGKPRECYYSDDHYRTFRRIKE